MAYRKIKKDDVLKLMIGISVNLTNPTNVISVPNIAYFLKTSKYQVRKYINELRNEGLVEVDVIPYFGDECQLPIKGFCITSNVEELDEFKRQLKEELDLIKKLFG